MSAFEKGDKKDRKKDSFHNDIFRSNYQERPNGGASWASQTPPREPERVSGTPLKEPWPAPRKRTDRVFAKSCVPEKWAETCAGTEIESASNFGKVMIAGAMRMPSTSTAVAAALDADLGLGYVAGSGIMQNRLTWILRAAGGPASIFILGMLPSKMGDGTLHSDDELRLMPRAPSRVRFQFRQDAEGVLRVYGIHSTETGDESVRIVQATWNADKTAMEAKLNGITILWTPKSGPLGDIPPLIYPDDTGKELGNILVHPIPENTDSEIEGFPGENITLDDCIVVFPSDTLLKSLYVVFARPFNPDHGFHKAPERLKAFPDAVKASAKTSVQGGGARRKRWKDANGRIYEWDSQHGAVEMYDRQGKHLGEYNPETGLQTKPAVPGRKVEK
jgi:hypothetical protein